MPKISFFGASEEVTGSCFLVEGENETVLVDCGLFQGSRFASDKNYEKLPFPCSKVDHVLVTHAHLDHTGRIPKICMEGFAGKIYATAPTLDMARFLWNDALEIMEIDYQQSGQLPLYSPKQAEEAISHFRGVKYGETVTLGEGVSATFHDAGHILGSAFIELEIDGKKLVFSGDIGNVDPPIIRETKPLPENIDLLLCESTYGNRIHEGKDERESALLKMITETVERGGTLMIPAFAIERTQEILYHLNTLIEQKRIPRIPVFLDSPLAIEMTSVFQKYPEFYNKDDYLMQKGGDDLFDFPGLTLTKTRQESKQINSTPGPKIIVAGSGMMNGGRISFHLQRYLPYEKNTLFIVGYQAHGTLGRKLLDGAKNIHVFRSSVPVQAHVHAIGAYSAHADQKKLLHWLGEAQNLKKVALTHGDRETMPVFSDKIKQTLELDVMIPKFRDIIEI